ncbi:TlpA family protein disulfide reductase [Humidisolicoccus flavus]|uniref:TlpA family protein disulfide reductase n=1 Tax=Humidisolicoccus flavus TaxID=3111414 RepID=UPI00324AAAE0
MKTSTKLFASLGALALLLSGCTSSDGVAGGGGASDTGYVSGGGYVTEIPLENRGEAIDFSGTTTDDGTFDSADYRGQVVVVNFWYASCPPCRVEAPYLAALDLEYDDAVFIGVNVRDSAPTAEGFDTQFDIEYPSILDADSGSVQLAFAGNVAPNAVPTTIVLDTEGRIASRISGALDGESTLSTLIRDTLAEAN